MKEKWFYGVISGDCHDAEGNVSKVPALHAGNIYGYLGQFTYQCLELGENKQLKLYWGNALPTFGNDRFQGWVLNQGKTETYQLTLLERELEWELLVQKF